MLEGLYMSNTVDNIAKALIWIKKDENGKWTVSFGLKDYFVIWATFFGAQSFNSIANTLFILKHLFS